ncbi:BTAD domain-containing putative transcriptional regulator [Micromonospora sp. NPDC007208]|uniref:AfsR/SARP family transcriptional regulator n=1 Tax=Micromonospora sp. NPDC007208 TaxID=3364236 RepID=UPI00368A2C8C
MELGTPQQRAILAALLLHEGTHVSAHELVEVVWGRDAPTTGVRIVRTYVSRLRRVLESDPGQPPVIASVAGGYVLPVTAETLDLVRFRWLTTQADLAQQGSGPVGAVALLREADALFRGGPLAGVPGGWAEAQRARLTQVRLAAVERRLALDLELGRHVEVAAEVGPLVAEHPLRERLRVLQMLALHQAGMPAEAFAVFHDARRALAEELGVEPGPALQEIHQRVLRADPILRSDPAVLMQPGPPAVPALHPPAPPEPQAVQNLSAVPAQLPPDLGDFTGREETVRTLSALLTRTGEVPVVGIVGLGGVGKSALAIRVATMLREQFPDGQLYADLGGMGEQPADPSDVLARFLRAFGIGNDAMPEALPERAALWRTIMAGRRVLVVLDDPYDSRQLRYLLPATIGSAAIITSWRRLLDLSGISWTTLGVLRSAESVTLLERIVGAERLRREPENTQRLVDLCSHHPAALRIAGARLAARPDWSVALVERRLLGELDGLAEPHEDCAAFYTSLMRVLRRLDSSHSSAFRLLAAPDLADISLAAAAVILDRPVSETERILDSLTDVHLLEPDLSGRYRYVGVVKALARVQLLFEGETASGKAAVGRLARFYLASARNAIQAVDLPPEPATAARSTGVAVADGLTFDDAETADSWLLVERANVLGVAAQVADVAESSEDTMTGWWSIQQRLTGLLRQWPRGRLTGRAA